MNVSAVNFFAPTQQVNAVKQTETAGTLAFSNTETAGSLANNAGGTFCAMA